MIEHVRVNTGVVDRDREFTAFMAEHADDLLRTAWLLVGDRHRAEELTQQALVRAYTAWSRAREGDPLAYTRRILINLRVDTWRRRRLEVVTDRVPERSVPDDTARVADRDQLVRALALLTTRQRRIRGAASPRRPARVRGGRGSRRERRHRQVHRLARARHPANRADTLWRFR